MRTKATLRYGLKFGGRFLPPGTEVEVLSADDTLVKMLYPEMTANPQSSQVAVKFADRNTPTIMHVSEIKPA